MCIAINLKVEDYYYNLTSNDFKSLLDDFQNLTSSDFKSLRNVKKYFKDFKKVKNIEFLNKHLKKHWDSRQLKIADIIFTKFYKDSDVAFNKNHIDGFFPEEWDVYAYDSFYDNEYFGSCFYKDYGCYELIAAKFFKKFGKDVRYYVLNDLSIDRDLLEFFVDNRYAFAYYIVREMSLHCKDKIFYERGPITYKNHFTLLSVNYLPYDKVYHIPNRGNAGGYGIWDERTVPGRETYNSLWKRK